MARIRISYNAPVVLTFALLSAAVLLLPEQATFEWFTTHPELDSFAAYVSLITHILGHQNWEHLIGNFMLILLVGPILEERFGSISLLVMIVITALVSGLIESGLDYHVRGASGIVFMMILLASTANIRQGEIPLTFIAVAAIYLGHEVVKLFDDDNISQLGHILGGVAGAVFGFLGAKARGRDPAIKPSALEQMVPSPTSSLPTKKSL